MHHLRRTVQSYNKMKREDLREGDCSFPFCRTSNTSQPSVIETATMYVIENRTAYDIFEGRRVLEHLMLLPKRHVETLRDFTDQEKIEYATVVGEYEAKGYNIYSRGVGSITRSMSHVHTHMIQMQNKRSRLLLYIAKPYYLFFK